MSKKPTYKELEKRVKELKDEVAEFKSVERNLKISNSAMESSINAIGITDLGGKLIYVNDSAVKMWGYDNKDEIIGKFLPEFWKGEGVFETIKALLKKGEAVGEDIGKRKDGSLFNAQFSASMIKDDAGNPLYMFGSFFDITERKQAEEKLKQSEKKYRELIEGSRDGYAMVDLQGKIMASNSIFREMLGYTEQELLEKSYMDITPEKWRSVEADIFEQQVYKRGYSDVYEKEFIRKDGSVFPIEIRTYLTRNENSENVGMWAFVRDVSERKRVEEAWKETYDIVVTVIDSIDADVYVADMDTYEILLMNKHMRKSFGRDLVGKLCWEVFRGDSGPCLHCTNDKLINEDGEPSGVCVWEGHNPITGRWYLNYDRAVRWKDGRFVRLQVATDITERKQMEEVLRESEERYRSVFENTGTATAIDEEDMTVSMANAEFEKLSGYSKEEIEGKLKWTQFISKEDLVRLKDLHANRRENEGNTPAEYEFRFVDRQGDTKDIFLKTALIPGTKKTISSLMDVTARKKVEKALRESEAKYRELVQNANSIIFRMNTEGNITFFNEFAQSFFGYDEDEIIGKNLVGTIVPKTDSAGQDLAAMIQDLLVHPDQYATNENENMRMNGERVWVVWTNKAIRDKDGNIVEILCVGNDNTERKRAEEAQRETEELFNAFMKHLPALAFMKDVDGRYLYFNEACTTFYNTVPSERIGKTDDDLFPVEVAKHLRENDKKVIRTGEGIDTVERIQVGDEVQYHHISKFPIHKEGAPHVLAGIAIDITDRVQAEEENKKLEDQLQQAQKMEAIGTLAGGIAHDFNNILSAIMGYAELSMLEIPDQASTIDNLNEILKASHRAKDMVKQILAFSRQNKQERIPIQVSPIVKEALKMLRASLPTTIEIRQHIDNGIGIVEADATQIHQVLMNLSTNAAHAINEKGGILEIGLTNVDMDAANSARHSDLRPGPYVRLTVSDTGHGMTRDVMERIFEPYFTTKEKGVGTGMGLAVTHGIVKSHGGAITVEGKPGKGSTFNVYIPRIEKEVIPKAVATEVLHTGCERILFVDDEQVLVEIGKQMLEKLGYEVTTRTSSIEALELFRVKPDQFDLVITDMTMPNMTGEKLAKELMGIRADIPIVLCTGYSERIAWENAIEMGIRELVMKPLTMSDLSKTIRKVLTRN